MAAGDLKGIHDLIGGHVQLIGDLHRTGLPAVFLFKTVEGFSDLVEGPHSIEGKTDDSGLFCQCLENGLTNPPYGV